MFAITTGNLCINGGLAPLSIPCINGKWDFQLNGEHLYMVANDVGVGSMSKMQLLEEVSVVNTIFISDGPQSRGIRYTGFDGDVASCLSFTLRAGTYLVYGITHDKVNIAIRISFQSKHDVVLDNLIKKIACMESSLAERMMKYINAILDVGGSEFAPVQDTPPDEY
jgi:hypothetical protein